MTTTIAELSFCSDCSDDMETSLTGSKDLLKEAQSWYFELF